MKPCLFGCALWASTIAALGQDEMARAPGKERQREAQARQQREAEHKKGAGAAERERQLLALREDLASPWTSVVIALRYDCSCTGTARFGFRIIRDDAGVCTVAPWAEDMGWFPGQGRERVGESRQLTQTALDKLLSEAALFYLAATLSEAPEENAGPRPPHTDATKQAEWRQRYLAAGGTPERGDRIWVEIRAATPEGLKEHANMWETQAPQDFSTWVAAFGTLPFASR